MALGTGINIKEKDITTAVDKRAEELKDLYDRFEEDLDKHRLTPYNMGKDYENVTSNQPRTLLYKLINPLAYAPVKATIPLQEENEEERRDISKGEYLFYGCMNLANSRLKSVVSPTIQALLAYYSGANGWYAERVFIHKKHKKGKTIPDIQVWDLRQVTWDVGGDGLLWACHTKLISSKQAETEHNVDATGIFGKSKNNIKVYDFWDDEINAIIVNGEFTKKPTKHNLDHIPIFINFVGPTPFIQSTKFEDTIKDMGEGALASNRNLTEPINKMLTSWLTIVAQGAHNPLAITSSGGKKTFEKSPYYKGAVVQLDADKNEKVEPLYKPEMPKEAQAAMAQLQTLVDMGGLSAVNYGMVPFGESGYQTNILRQLAIEGMVPIQKAVEEGLTWIHRELLTQYAKSKLGKLKLHGRNGSNEYFDVELSPQDVKGDWFPEVKIQPSLPQDFRADAATASLLVRDGLYSRLTARDQILLLQNPELEEDRVLIEQARRIPSLMVRDMAIKLIEVEGRPDLAKALIREFESKVTMEEEKTRPRGEAVQPEYATGLPEEALPPEELGRVQSESPGNI